MHMHMLIRPLFPSSRRGVARPCSPLLCGSFEFDSELCLSVSNEKYEWPNQEAFSMPPENTDVQCFISGGLRQPPNLQGGAYSGHKSNWASFFFLCRVYWNHPTSIYVFSCAEHEAPARRLLLTGGSFFLYRLGILWRIYSCSRVQGAGGDDP